MTLACWITSVRFILAPLIYWQLTKGTKAGIIAALGLLLLAGLSDVLDGKVARARNEVTELGKTLDPLSDKITIFTVLIALAIRWKLPLILAVVYFIKELFQVLAGVYLLRKYKQLIAANQWGKSSTVIFFLGIGTFFINKWFGILVIIIALLISIYALYTYYLAYQKDLRQSVSKRD
ncbi:MAG TPA: CDP-alcohol phosphatidyltransferase family protein [Bacillota bacterium]|nr:CDP-alcohol phosphatidyltransferase family protein [Bacillota bacterium]HOL10167.1 CDP-alcohol phosphatidyltransferase family protein [Bacillota bacterium]HPO97898.1 CDP-alcohol phosphatidyltransferase family protein [Bacillota bacterium]